MKTEYQDVFLPTIRVRSEEANELRRMAIRDGITLTTWIRRTLFHAAGITLDKADRPVGRPAGSADRKPRRRLSRDGAE